MDTTITLLGPPGSGKGTQGERLRDRLGFAVLSTGELLRAERAAGTELGRRAGAAMDRGDLVTDEVVLTMVDQAIGSFDGRPIALDGFPRTLEQARALGGVLEGHARELTAAILIDVPDEEVVRRITARRQGRDVTAAILIDVPDEVVVERISGRGQGRSDDNPDTVRERLRVYHRDTEPLVSHFAELGVLRRVDGALDADSVEDEIRAALGER